MGISTRATHDRDGNRIGSYVYMLLCQRGEIFVKIGVSDDPIKRLVSLMVGCPIEPGVLAAVKMPSRQVALKAETALHEAMFSFRSRGEWFAFKPEDKPEFNHRLKSALAQFESSSFRVDWAKLNVKQLMMQRNQAAYVARKQAMRDRAVSRRFDVKEPSSC